MKHSIAASALVSALVSVLVPVLACGLVACSARTQAPAGPAPAAEAPAARPSEPAAAAPSRVVTEHFHSDALGVDKAVVIYLPRGYDSQPARRWPVFYYLHGLGGDETNWVKHGQLDAAADQLGLAAIVVMPDGDDDFYIDSAMPIDYDACMRDGTGLLAPHREDHAATCVRHRAYETYIVHDLIAEVDARFRTIASRDGRAIAGLSMGGYGALVLAMRHPDLFAAVASHSGVDSLMYVGPHPYVAGKVELVTDPRTVLRGAGELGAWIRGIFGPDLADWKAHDPSTLVASLSPGQLAIYLDCGTEDDFALDAGASYLHDLLTARHIDHAFFLGPGHHDFAFWTARLPESLKYLRDHVAAARG